MKKIELLFYRTNPSKENTGVKHCLWEITDDQGIITHDWGFAVWNGEGWADIEIPEGYQAKVHSWANTVNPAALINEPGKIISL